jgi:putative hydrolase of the HAD superfamily
MRSFFNSFRRMSAIQSPRGRGKALLITFDAFSTLFHPRRPVPELYASIAHSFGLPKSKVTDERLQAAFKTAFKAQSKAYPNYGREQVLRGRYQGPRQWWSDLIKMTFAKVLDDETKDLPAGMVEKLLDAFASDEGYALFDDVQPFFRDLKTFKMTKGAFDHVVTGVISNSDDRVPAILKSFGLSIGNIRADRDRSSMELPGFEQLGIDDGRNPIPKENDIDMIITSYEAGQEKPNRLIYDVAARQAQQCLPTMDASGFPGDSVEWTRIHVGDDAQKDYTGAIDAGWHSLLISREDTTLDIPKDAKHIDSLQEVITEIESI